MLDLINLIKKGPPKRPEVPREVPRAREYKPRGTWNPWTEKDISTLKEMAGKHSTEEIAKHLGRTPNAVAQRAHHLGISLSTRELDPTIIDMVHVLREAGYSMAQIISAFNVPTERAKAVKRGLKDHK